MKQDVFIDLVSGKIIESCQKHNLIPSPTIAQAILESGWGDSQLAKEANAIFGIKAGAGWEGKKYLKQTSEYQNGQYVTVQSYFRAYDSWDESIVDHTNFLIGNKRYNNLVGVRDYAQYCQLLQSDGYATAPNYAETLIELIEKYNLVRFDAADSSPGEDTSGNPNKTYNLHAGHNPAGKVACGAVGYLNESAENRKVCYVLKELMQRNGYKVYDCTCNDGTSKNDVLEKICAACNKNVVDLDISIHFNSFDKEYVSDKKTKGVEAYIYPTNIGTDVEAVAKDICMSVASLGFTNRGVKTRDDLYYLKNTKNKAILIECCFVDDIDDFELYDCGKMAKAIFDGLGCVDKSEADTRQYYVIAGVFDSEQNAINLSNALKDGGYLADSNGNLIRGIVTQVKKM